MSTNMSNNDSVACQKAVDSHSNGVGDTYKIGRLGKPHGVRGEIQMQFSDDICDRTDADYVFLKIDGLLVPFFIEEYRFRSDDVVLMKFCDVDDADRARELTGCDVYFPRNNADDDEENITWAEIIGYTVVDSANEKAVGTIRSVDDSTINILLSVVDNDGNEHLVPISEDLVKALNKKEKTITIDIPEGLLDL